MRASLHTHTRVCGGGFNQPLDCQKVFDRAKVGGVARCVLGVARCVFQRETPKELLRTRSGTLFKLCPKAVELCLELFHKEGLVRDHQVLVVVLARLLSPVEAAVE